MINVVFHTSKTNATPSLSNDLTLAGLAGLSHRQNGVIGTPFSSCAPPWPSSAYSPPLWPVSRLILYFYKVHTSRYKSRASLTLTSIMSGNPRNGLIPYPVSCTDSEKRGPAAAAIITRKVFCTARAMASIWSATKPDFESIGLPVNFPEKNGRMMQ